MMTILIRLQAESQSGGLGRITVQTKSLKRCKSDMQSSAFLVHETLIILSSKCNIERKILNKGNNSMKVLWNIPSLFGNDSLMIKMIRDAKSNNKSLPISSVYGSPRCGWNGGRPVDYSCEDYDTIQKLFDEYNSLGIGVCLAMNNYNLTDSDLNDEYCNTLCRALSEISGDRKDINNYVIVSSQKLSDYLRAKYGNLKQICSVLKPVFEHPDYDETPEYYNELANTYDRVVIRPEWNTDWEYMAKLNCPEKFEILINQSCAPFCKYAIDHYFDIASYNRHSLIRRGKPCMAKELKITPESEHSLYVRPDDQNKLASMGFTQFKLQGRGREDDVFLEIFKAYVMN